MNDRAFMLFAGSVGYDIVSDRSDDNELFDGQSERDVCVKH